jgi:hypothetical protein
MQNLTVLQDENVPQQGTPGSRLPNTFNPSKFAQTKLLGTCSKDLKAWKIRCLLISEKVSRAIRKKRSANSLEARATDDAPHASNLYLRINPIW